MAINESLRNKLLAACEKELNEADADLIQVTREEATLLDNDEIIEYKGRVYFWVQLVVPPSLRENPGNKLEFEFQWRKQDDPNDILYQYGPFDILRDVSGDNFLVISTRKKINNKHNKVYLKATVKYGSNVKPSNQVEGTMDDNNIQVYGYAIDKKRKVVIIEVEEEEDLAGNKGFGTPTVNLIPPGMVN